jgi:hypothetical protein
MELLAGLAATEDEVPHDNDPRTAVMRTIHSSKFSTENSLRQICSRLQMSLVLSAIRGSLSSEAKQWLERTRVRLMRSGSVVGSLWTPSSSGHTANSSGLLDSRQPSPTEVLFRAVAMLLCREQDLCASYALADVLLARARREWYKLLAPRKGRTPCLRASSS